MVKYKRLAVNLNRQKAGKMTVETLMEMEKNGKVELLHTSSRRGYLSRKKVEKLKSITEGLGKGIF